MKRIDRYIIISFLQLLSITVLLLTFIMLLFDVFSNLERYLQAEATLYQMLLSTLMFLPEAISFTLPPSALFASTYMLSMMYANNEMIILANSGYSFTRIIIPLIVTALLLTSLFFVFNEHLTRQFKVMKSDYEEMILDTTSSDYSSKLILTDEDGRYVMYARRYNEKTESFSTLSLFLLDEDGQLTDRYNAKRAQYAAGAWEAEDIHLYKIDEEGKIHSLSFDTLVLPEFDLSPQVISQRSVDINTMDMKAAFAYVDTLRRVHNPSYKGYEVDLYQRISMNFAPLILIMISCATVIPWKKNVLVLSIITSISIAVIYYVLILSGTILARQEIVASAYALFIPPAFLFAAAGTVLILRRK